MAVAKSICADSHDHPTIPLLISMRHKQNSLIVTNPVEIFPSANQSHNVKGQRKKWTTGNTPMALNSHRRKRNLTILPRYKVQNESSQSILSFMELSISRTPTPDITLNSNASQGNPVSKLQTIHFNQYCVTISNYNPAYLLADGRLDYLQLP